MCRPQKVDHFVQAHVSMSLTVIWKEMKWLQLDEDEKRDNTGDEDGEIIVSCCQWKMK